MEIFINNRGREPAREVLEMARSLYHDEKAIALVPATAVVADYTLTFFFAGSERAILAFEYSPLVRFAVENGIMPLYVFCMVLFYAGAAWLVLRALRDSPLYPCGVAIILLVSLTHVLGGLSWAVQAPWYSNAVITISFTLVGVALAAFAYTVFLQKHPVRK